MIKKLLIAIIGLSAFSISQASHLAGGGVTWEHLGGRDYIFHLIIVNKCRNSIFPPPSTIIAYAGGTIRVTRDSNVVLPEPGKSNGCDLTLSFYSGDTVTFSPSLDFSKGQRFFWSHCCTDDLSNWGGVQSLYVESTLYGDGQGNPAPISTYKAQKNTEGYLVGQVSPVRGKNSLLLGSKPVPGNDVIESSLAPVYVNDSTVGNFKSGFSAQLPLPDNTESPLNGAFQFDAPAGIATYDIALDTGLYLYNLKQKFYKGHLLGFRRLQAEVNNFVLHHLYNPGKNNNAPGLNLPKAFAPRIITFPGDSLNLKFKGIDLGETVSLQLISPGLDKSFFVSPGVPITQVLQWSSDNNNGSFSSQDSSVATLTWQPNLLNLQGPRLIPVQVAARDSQGASSKTIWKSFVIELVEPVEISTGGAANSTFTKSGCNQKVEATTLSGRIRWTPASAVANDTALQTTFTGSTTTTLSAFDPAAPLFKETLRVIVVDTTKFTLQNNFGQSILILENNTLVPDSAIQWFINDFPFRFSKDSLVNATPGIYKVELNLGDNCTLKREKSLSQLFCGLSCMRFGWSSFDSVVSTVKKALPLDSMRGFSFDASTLPNKGQPSFVTLFGINEAKGKRADSARLGFTLYNNSSGAVLDSGNTVLQRPFPGFVSFSTVGFNWPKSGNLTLVWHGDSNLRFDALKMPASIPSAGVIPLVGAPNSGIPTQQSSFLPATAIAVDFVSSLKEDAFSQIDFYPNPSQGEIVWTKPLPDNGIIKVITAAGRVVHQQEVAGGTTRLTLPELPAGMYIMQLGETSFKLYLE